jgi:uncharacterized protein (TIRG00374 family)
MNALKSLARPNVLIPAVVAVALLLALLAFGNPRQIGTLLAGFQVFYLLYFFLVMVAYEAVRCAQWHFMLTALGIRVPLQTQVFSYISGEVTKDLPIGNFFPDYVLQRSKGTDFGLASSATLLITLIEVAVSLAGVVIIGIDGWEWLRPLILVGTFVFVLIAWAFYRWHHHPHVHRPHPRLQMVLRRKGVQKALDELRQFIRGEATLLHPQVLAVGALLGAIYLTLGGVGLYLVVRGLGLGGISFWQCLAVYYFSLAVAAIVPLPLDFGTIEVSGAGALVAIGVSRAGAVSAVLLSRLLNLAATLLIALVVTLVLRGELRAALSMRREPPATQSAAPEPAPGS